MHCEFGLIPSRLGSRLGAALVYGKVRAALGIRRAAISGGGSLAPHLDDFYESVSSDYPPTPCTAALSTVRRQFGGSRIGESCWVHRHVAIFANLRDTGVRTGMIGLCSPSPKLPTVLRSVAFELYQELRLQRDIYQASSALTGPLVRSDQSCSVTSEPRGVQQGDFDTICCGRRLA